MAYKEKQLDENAAKALIKAWGDDNEKVLKRGKKEPAKKTETKTTGKKSGK